MSESICIKKKLIDHKVEISKKEFPYLIRSCNTGDIDELGRLYFESYGPGIACSSLEESVSDVKNSFSGEYGPFSQKYSLVIEGNNTNSLIGAILVVEHNSWDDQLKCPYIIELYIDRNFRRKGLAKKLIMESLNMIKASKKKEVALTVSLDNKPAWDLYKSLGFTS